MSSIGGSAKNRMERILRLQEEIDDIKADIRDIYAEEKADGGDKTAMGAAIAILRKRGKDRNAFDDREALTDVYLNVYSGTSIATHMHAREAIETEPQVALQPAQSLPAQAPVDTPLTGQGGDESPVIHSETAPTGAQENPASEHSLAHAGLCPSAAGQEVSADRQPNSPVAPPSTIIPFNPEMSREERALRMRPHCQRPGSCAGVGSGHCFSCLKAMGTGGDAA